MELSDPIPLSAFQHWCYCPRQCGLIHLEQAFEENVHTLRGRAVHSAVDTPGLETRAGMRMERAVPVFHDRLGWIGKADTGPGTVSPGSVAFEAGRIMLRRLEELARVREDFAFESTLVGLSAHRLLSGLVDVGYDVHVFYLWLPSAEMAIARVRRRVEAGGHDVPVSVIRRRFWRSLVNFDRLYRPLATTWRRYDSGGLGGRALLAHGARKQPLVILDHTVWLEIRKGIEETHEPRSVA